MLVVVGCWLLIFHQLLVACAFLSDAAISLAFSWLQSGPQCVLAALLPTHFYVFEFLYDLAVNVA